MPEFTSVRALLIEVWVMDVYFEFLPFHVYNVYILTSAHVYPNERTACILVHGFSSFFSHFKLIFDFILIPFFSKVK